MLAELLGLLPLIDAQLVLAFILVVPFIAVVASATIRIPNVREAISLIVALLLFLGNLVLYLHYMLSDVAPTIALPEMVPGIAVSYSVEPLALLMTLVASFLWMVSIIYSIGYMRGNKEAHQSRFFACFAIAILATMHAAYAANLFTLFVWYEVLTISTYPLVTHAGTDQAKAAGRTYLGILMGASFSFFLVAIIWTYQLAGTLDFTPGGIMPDNMGTLALSALLLLYVYGIGKAAVMPLHRWLPAAMVAPTPVSALLHAVAVVKVGVFSIVKILLLIFGLDFFETNEGAAWSIQLVTYVAGFTIIAASLVALRQTNLKRMLAYSTISQLSYVVLAASMVNGAAMTAAIFHIAAHAFGKITLFFAAGSIYTASKKKELSELSGIARQMPLTIFAFTIGALVMIGLPPLAGFTTKYYMLMGAVDASHLFAIIVIITSTFLNAAYFLPVIWNALFGKPKKKDSHGEAPKSIQLALVITSLGCVLLFIFPQPVLTLSAKLTGDVTVKVDVVKEKKPVAEKTKKVEQKKVEKPKKPVKTPKPQKTEVKKPVATGLPSELPDAPEVEERVVEELKPVEPVPSAKPDNVTKDEGKAVEKKEGTNE